MAVMPRIAVVAIGIAATALIAQETAKLAFDAASVKPTTLPQGVGLIDGMLVNAGPYHESGGPGSADPGRIHYPLASLTGLLKRAYQGYFDIKVPAWADSDTVAVDATMPPTTTKEQFQKMLQNLLVVRFALKTHVETKDLTGYVLTVAAAPKFQESKLPRSAARYLQRATIATRTQTREAENARRSPSGGSSGKDAERQLTAII